MTVSDRVYRVRRGWRGQSVLQVRISVPLHLGSGVIAPEIRHDEWIDVDYSRAPLALRAVPIVRAQETSHE